MGKEGKGRKEGEEGESLFCSKTRATKNNKKNHIGKNPLFLKETISTV